MATNSLACRTSSSGCSLHERSDQWTAYFITPKPTYVDGIAADWTSILPGKAVRSSWTKESARIA